MLIELQSLKNNSEWPEFYLNKIPRLCKSARINSTHYGNKDKWFYFLNIILHNLIIIDIFSHKGGGVEFPVLNFFKGRGDSLISYDLVNTNCWHYILFYLYYKPHGLYNKYSVLNNPYKNKLQLSCKTEIHGKFKYSYIAESCYLWNKLFYSISDKSIVNSKTG